MKGILTSRKFWAAGIGLLVIIITAFLPGFPAIQQPLTDVTLLVSAYILGTAVEGQRLSTGSAIQGLMHSRKFWAGTGRSHCHPAAGSAARPSTGR